MSTAFEACSMRCYLENSAQVAMLVRLRTAMHFLAVLSCTVLLSACADDPTTAPYHYGSGQGYVTGSLDETPITTELHTYDEDAGEGSYKIRGAPLRLTFPGKYYGYSTNLEGGPQFQVILRLDGQTLRPSVDVVRERYGVKTSDEISNKIDGEGLGTSFRRGPYRDSLTVEILKRVGSTHTEENREKNGIITSWKLVKTEARALSEQGEDDFPLSTHRRLGKLCKFDIYSDRKFAPPSLKEQLPLDEFGNITGAGGPFTAINADKSSPVKGAYCEEKPAHCFVLIEHRGYNISVNMDRNHLCAFWPAYREIPSFIDQHATYPLPH